jgi:hypothetical protein
MNIASAKIIGGVGVIIDADAQSFFAHVNRLTVRIGEGLGTQEIQGINEPAVAADSHCLYV